MWEVRVQSRSRQLQVARPSMTAGGKATGEGYTRCRQACRKRFTAVLRGGWVGWQSLDRLAGCGPWQTCASHHL